MRRRILFSKYTYSNPRSAYVSYGTVPVNGVTADDDFLPYYYVTVTETRPDKTSHDLIIYSSDKDKKGLEFYFDITPDNRTDVNIVHETGALIVGESTLSSSSGYYGVGTVKMTVTLGDDNTTATWDVSQATNEATIIESYAIKITKFTYDTASADGTNALYPYLDFTVTQTMSYSDGSPTTETEYNISYEGGKRIDSDAFNNATIQYSVVSGNFVVNSSTGMVSSISQTDESGTDSMDLGQVHVYINIENYAYDEANSHIYQYKQDPLSEDSFPMSVLMLNKDTHEQVILEWDKTYADYPKATYTPIGIVLTPKAEGDTVSGYGKDWMGVMALTDASLSSPEGGTTNPSTIMLGNSTVYEDKMETVTEASDGIMTPSILLYCDEDGKPTDSNTGIVDNIDGYPDYENTDESNVSVATDKNSTVAAVGDAWAGYANKNGHKALSPYEVSDEFKEVYGEDGDFENYNAAAYEKCELSGEISALSDYNGELNSLAILLGKSWNKGREWIEDTTSNSNSSITDCPAVEACWKYAPEGTATGGWYLPALGELSLMAARFNKINDTLLDIADHYEVNVSLLKDTSTPYLSSTHYVSYFDGNDVKASTVLALFPNINGDMVYNRVGTTTISGVQTSGYVRPFKKIKSGAGTYELMPAHYTDTFCNGNSKREWTGQKFIISFRRACMGYMNTAGFQGMDGSTLRIYGYKVKGENDTTKVDESPRLLAEMYVSGLTLDSSSYWPQVSNGQGGYKYEGDEMGVNIVGRFSTKYQFDTDGAFDEEKGDYADMDTDEFDRDGTVEPGWYILDGIGVTATNRATSTEEVIVSAGSYRTITKKEIDVVDGVESKEAFFDEIRHSTLFNLTEQTDAPFYVGQLDRPVAILLGATSVSESD